MLKKNTPVSEITAAERQLGKCAELACGFGGGLGAWRRIAGDDGRSDAEVQAIIRTWRDAHPAIRAFWHDLAQAARVAIRIGQPILVAPAPRPPIIAAFDGYTLTLTLPSGRAITYPGAHLAANTKFEDGDPDVEFFDNARGPMEAACGPGSGPSSRTWCRAPRATCSRPPSSAPRRAAGRLSSIATTRSSSRRRRVSVSEQEVLALLLEPPAWATGLPLGGKVHAGQLYLEAPETAEPPPPRDRRRRSSSARSMCFVAATRAPIPGDRAQRRRGLPRQPGRHARAADRLRVAADGLRRAGLVPVPRRPEPICKIYPDHFYCYGCGERGDRIDWLTRVEGMTRDRGHRRASGLVRPGILGAAARTTTEELAFALRIWNAAQPLAGTIGEHYLAETRGIDVDPAAADDPRGAALPSELRLRGREHAIPASSHSMRDPLTDAPVGIHRIGLTQENGAGHKIDRMALGHMGVVKLWPAGEQLVVGEGIETVLAAATRISYRGAALTPAWSAVARGGLGRLPVLPNVQQSHSAGRQRHQRRGAEGCRALPTRSGAPQGGPWCR